MMGRKTKPVINNYGSLGVIQLLLLLSYFSGQVTAVAVVGNYDFIIAGGGTGGLALARRLAESGKHSVLVLESGDFPKEGMDVPAFAPRFLGDPDVTFQYSSAPQRNAGQWNTDGVMTMISGRVLSGTSNINYMFYNRGNPRDYDNWGNITGDSNWNYNNLLKYFKRIETYRGDFPSDQHGDSGPISITRPKYAPGLEPWLAAGVYLGYPIADPNGPQRRSFTPVEFAKRFGRRDSAYPGYIKPIINMTPKLKIILTTNVTQIVFNGARAIGVRFASTSPELSSQRNSVLYANKEIIVSAGTFGSPQLLMRSGVGPRNVLRAANIPLVRDLPVGQNFQNHVLIPVPVVLNNRSVVMDDERDLTAENWAYYNNFGDGPFSSTQGNSGQGFVVSSVAAREGEPEWPDIHYQASHSVQYFFASGLTNTSFAPWEGPMGVGVFLTRPKSRGSIRLDPRDPNGPPIIEVGYLSDPRDAQKCFDGIKELLRVFEQTPSYRTLGARIPPVDIPDCQKFPFPSDDYWRCYVRYNSRDGCRPVGTCRMGRVSYDPEAVVDTKLKVIGIIGLRVVDASVMPVITNTNTHAAVYVIAEKAAEMILAEWY